MDRFAPLPTIIPLVSAAFSLLAVRHLWIQRVIAVVALAASLGISIALLVHADREGPAVARLGGWSASIGISYVIDRLGAQQMIVPLAGNSLGGHTRTPAIADGSLAPDC